MAKTLGYMRCPVCGRKTDIRENKNGILYTYCPYNHHAKLSRDDSNEAKKALENGQQWNNGVIYLYPNNKQENERNIENGTNTGTTTGTTEIRRRIDGGSTANTAIGNTTTGTIAESDEWDGECGMFD